MFEAQQKVLISSTQELPTAHDGKEGWIMRRMTKKYPDFWVVVLKDGTESVFHESQLKGR